MKYSEVVKLLKKNGCYLVGHGKKHDKWCSPITGRYFMLPRHQSEEAKTKTLNSILEQAGIKL